MDQVNRTVSIARRRSILQSFLDWISYVGLISLSIAAVAVILAKFITVPLEFTQWVQVCLITAAVVTVFGALLCTLLTKPSRSAVATSVDQRLNLRERISSASQLSQAERATPMGEALWLDANKRAESLDVRDAFPMKIKSHYVRWLAPIAMIGCSYLLADPSASNSLNNSSEQALSVTQVKNSVEPLIKRVRKQREEAEKSDLDEAELFKNLESQLENLKANPPKDPTKFMAEINKMQDKLNEKRREMGTGESLKKQLAGIKSIDNGPAEKLADAMKEGDMEEASEQVKEMMEKLEKGELSKEEQKQLAKQLEQMQKALEEAVKAHEDQKKQLEEQIKQAEQSGDVEKAAELAQKLDQMKQADADMKNAGEMAKSLADAANSLSKGGQKEASEALAKMKSELSKMAKNAKNAESLKELSENMNNSKRSSSCKQCNGQGCAQCNSKGMSDKANNSKFAKGEGKGAGEREESKDDTSNFDSQVRGNVGKGETSFGGKIAGQNKKTPTQFEVRDAVLNSTFEDPDPIENARLPKRERDVSKEYMDALRTGQ